MNELDRELQGWLDGLVAESLSPEDLEKLQSRLKIDPAARRAYFAYVDVHLGLKRLTLSGIGDQGEERGIEDEAERQPLTPALSHAGRGRETLRRWQIYAALAAGLLVAVLLGLFAGERSGLFAPVAKTPEVDPPGAKGPQPVDDPAKEAAKAPPPPSVRVLNLAGARFFGELAPAHGHSLALHRDYVLMSGLVELRFPSRATAILEGPAVFRVLSFSSLALDVGQCSVHCPPGAEGFRVETQLANVVDRGTRFSVKVNEASETEVQVIEGLAELHPSQAKGPTGAGADAPAQIKQHEARKVIDDSRKVLPADYLPGSYRKELPDRVVWYGATLAPSPSGGVLELIHLMVQRGGNHRSYSIKDLIPVDAIGFCSLDTTDKNGHLAGGPVLPERRRDVLRDNSLITGLINPGGSREPLTQDPVFANPEDPENPNTPGLAVEFVMPVVNRPGPDVVLFEMQTVTNPADGDAFHVSPLRFAEGLRSHTVRQFDIGMTSGDAQKLAEFHLYRFDGPVRSLSELRTAPVKQTPVRKNFRILAVGIDLSNLGYADGAKVNGLFIQDAADDDHKVDPVMIVGLPE